MHRDTSFGQDTGAGLLRKTVLELRDISHWVIHAAGSKAVTNSGAAPGRPEYKLAVSRETPRLVMSASITSLGSPGKTLMESGEVRPGDCLVAVA